MNPDVEFLYDDDPHVGTLPQLFPRQTSEMGSPWLLEENKINSRGSTEVLQGLVN